MAEARGAHLIDVDGNEYVDFCLGDTGAMTGHTRRWFHLRDRSARLERGVQTMLPTEDAIWVGEELTRRFGLARLAVHDSRRPTRTGSCLRFAREVTGRPKVLVFEYCYHGTVDESFAMLDGDRSAPATETWGRPSIRR